MGTKRKTRQFEIPKDFIGTFFAQLDETDLSYKLLEVDADTETLNLVIIYAPEERDEVMNLIESLDEYLNDQEDDDDDEEEEDN